MSKRGSTPASRPTPFTVQAMRPRAAPSVLLRPDGYADAASGEPARHGRMLADSGWKTAHASSAANDETSSLSAHRMGWRPEPSDEECLQPRRLVIIASRAVLRGRRRMDTPSLGFSAGWHVMCGVRAAVDLASCKNLAPVDVRIRLACRRERLVDP
jgi:hypothetical protein